MTHSAQHTTDHALLAANEALEAALMALAAAEHASADRAVGLGLCDDVIRCRLGLKSSLLNAGRLSNADKSQMGRDRLLLQLPNSLFDLPAQSATPIGTHR